MSKEKIQKISSDEQRNCQTPDNCTFTIYFNRPDVKNTKIPAALLNDKSPFPMLRRCVFMVHPMDTKASGVTGMLKYRYICALTVVLQMFLAAWGHLRKSIAIDHPRMVSKCS
jgi:hypothetical protein